MFLFASTVFLIWTVLGSEATQLSVPQKDLQIQLGKQATFEVIARTITPSDVGQSIFFHAQHSDLLKLTPPSITLDENKPNYTILINTTAPGHSEITSNTSSPDINTDDLYLRVTIYRSGILDILSTVVGWLYFAAWSISFYPQIYDNWKRKSVIGLNFDFQGLNLIGFLLYFLFNIGLYAIPEIRAEYSTRHPRGLNPIQINDIIFAAHATFAVLVTIVQCVIYESGDQRVSLPARVIMGVFGGVLVISGILAASRVIHWLDFLYFCSYIKLTITLIKYVPQAWMNYKRKSTVGWSIGNIFLDFTGGILSMVQMFILSYNYDDWISIFGDITKFGLGLFSVMFDIFFLIQHYILYREDPPLDVQTKHKKTISYPQDDPKDAKELDRFIVI